MDIALTDFLNYLFTPIYIGKLYFHYKYLMLVYPDKFGSYSFIYFSYWMIFEYYTLSRLGVVFNFFTPIPIIDGKTSLTDETKKYKIYTLVLSLLIIVVFIAVAPR